MAEVTASDKSSEGKKRSKKQTTKIDMTPMVDLGFLLITFFMLTTTLSKPVIMKLNMPFDDGPTSVVPESGSLTVILGKADRIYYYQGLSDDPDTRVQTTDFSPEGIRKLLFNFKEKIGDDFTIVVKSTENAKYRNMVDLLDEFTITNNKHYGIVTITEKDKQLLSRSVTDY